MSLSKAARFLSVVAYVLFLGGAVLAYLENGSELSFWILGFGIALEVSLLLLALFGSPRIKFSLRQGKVLAIIALIAQVLALLISLFAIPVRFLSYINAFTWLLAASLLLWTGALFILLNAKHANNGENNE